MQGTIQVETIMQDAWRDTERQAEYKDRREKSSERHALWQLARCTDREDRKKTQELFATELARYRKRVSKLIVDNNQSN